MTTQHQIFRIYAAILILTGLTLSGCRDNKATPLEKKTEKKREISFPVEAIPVTIKPVQYEVNAVGSVEAYEQLQITSRVAGVVERVHITEGDAVTKDTVIAEIEPERFRLNVSEQEATLKKVENTVTEAEAGLARRKNINEKNPGLITGEEVENWQNRLNNAKAEKLQTQAALDMANLNLRDAIVKSPEAGVIQTKTVQTGQYVQPGTILATLIRRDPMLLKFQVPEQDAARLKPGMKASFRVRDLNQDIPAVLTFVAESADLTSRMVSVTGRIDVHVKGIRPGVFAQVKISIGKAKESPVIPQTAIRPSERGFLAFIVENGIAKERVLELGMRTAEGDVEVISGISPGDILIVRGAEALQDGVPVSQDKKQEKPL